MEKPFVTTQWLADRLGDPNLVILDGSWYLPAMKRDARAEYLASHIPGAVFFDIDGIADKSTPLPHMLPTPADFARMVGDLGVGDGMTIVAYDELGYYSAPRVWWEFTTMGAHDVYVLEGGGGKWRAEGRPLESGETKRAVATYTPRFHPELVRNFGQVKEASDAGDQIADARPNGRFIGRDPEPRPGLKSGHMPSSVSVPGNDLAVDGRLKSIDDLRAMFASAGLDLSQPIVTSCGSGVTASALMLALRIAGTKDVAVYDGSWAEWGKHPEATVISDV